MDQIVGQLIVIDVTKMNYISNEDDEENSQLSKGITKTVFIELGVRGYYILCHLSITIRTILIDSRLEPVPILIGFPCHVEHQTQQYYLANEVDDVPC